MNPAIHPPIETHRQSLYRDAGDWFRPPLLDAWYLSGPTASGKTDVALKLAQRINAEIVSLDSMAVYRHMDIGTAKPSATQLSTIPHHLIDVVNPDEDYSVSQFVMDAHRINAEIRSRGREVLFVGGTPLYLKTLLRGMFLGPEANWDFRNQVAADVAEYGIEALRNRLAQVDPLSAFKILPGDERRMTRALEVAKITGKPLSHWQTQFERLPNKLPNRVFVLGWERSTLHHRVADRVQRMFDAGLVEEVQNLVETYPLLSRTAMQAVGYKEPMLFLNGKQGIDETKEQVLIHTRQFVRRQEIWFRSLIETRRIEVNQSDIDIAHERILQLAV